MEAAVGPCGKQRVPRGSLGKIDAVAIVAGAVAPAVQDHEHHLLIADIGGLNQGAAGHLLGFLKTQHIQHGRCHIAQSAVPQLDCSALRIQHNEGNQIGGVCHMGLALGIVQSLDVTVVGGNSDQIAMGAGILGNFAHIAADGCGSLQLGLRIGGVSHHIAVGEVGQDKVIACVHGTLDLFGHFRQAQLRLLIEGDALGRRNADVGLAGEGLVSAAVEEEGHMGVFLRLSAVELGQARLTDYLRQRHDDLFGCEGDGQILEFVVIHGHDDKFQILQICTVKLVKRRIGEGFGQFDLPLAAAAAENHMIAVLDLAYGRSVFILQSHGLQMVVGLPLLICGLNGSCQSLAADKSLHNHCPPG